MKCKMISADAWHVKVQTMSVSELQKQMEIFSEVMRQVSTETYAYHCWLQMRNDCRREIEDRFQQRQAGEQLSLFRKDRKPRCPLY